VERLPRLGKILSSASHLGDGQCLHSSPLPPGRRVYLNVITATVPGVATRAELRHRMQRPSRWERRDRCGRRLGPTKAPGVYNDGAKFGSFQAAERSRRTNYQTTYLSDIAKGGRWGRRRITFSPLHGHSFDTPLVSTTGPSAADKDVIFDADTAPDYSDVRLNSQFTHITVSFRDWRVR